LKLDRTIDDQKQKSKESEEYREGLKQEIEGMERLQVEAYEIMRSKQSELEKFYRRNRMWFTPATCEKLDYFVEEQDKFVERLNPIEKRVWLEIAKPIDIIGGRINDTMKKFGIAEEQSQTSLVEQIESSNRWAEAHYVPALDAALQSIEDEFRRVMRVR
jgi:hypothetical protein